LTRACGQRGNPAFGSAGFTQALNDAEFFPSFARAVSEWQERLLSHPRASPVFRLRASSEELANRAVRMFREQYKPAADVFSQDAAREVESPAEVSKLLRRKGALSEVRLTHPALPFLGVLDRVQLINDGVEVVDFKTGRPSDSHRKQLFRYALLWWRATSEAPVRITAQYLNGAESWTVARQALEEVEVELAKALPQLSAALGLRPSVAKPSTACPSCAVRAHCSSGLPGVNYLELSATTILSGAVER
jgi:CRISPR/Cas system-associated exonuclease Cas4 (RecB family)